MQGAESDAARDFEAADSVTGFGAEDLAALGAQDIADLADFTPNLEIVTSGATTPTFFIRGVGLNDFNANSTGAVAIYQDDVAINAPAIQLGTLFDVEAVNVLRGPQGTGLARNASAGAIKIYSRKPTGEFGGFLRSELGNFGFRDFEGAVEAPIYEDILAGRFAFRFSERDGTMDNRCANASPLSERDEFTGLGQTNLPPASHCGEQVRAGDVSKLASGLPDSLNDLGNWAARGTLLFQPTLDASILLNAHGSQRDEFSRVGQAYGTLDPLVPGAAQSILLGGQQQQTQPGYQAPEVRRRRDQLLASGLSRADAMAIVGNELAQQLDSEPWAGDFNVCSENADVDGDISNGIQCPDDAGKTTNDTWGAYVKTDVALPLGMQLTSVTGFDTYDRLMDIDFDFSPETLFHFRTEDSGWQFVSDLKLEGQLGNETSRLRWDIGGWFLREQLDVLTDIDLGFLGVNTRDYTQDLWSAAGYMSLAFDFWDDFTLDGGVRYNWERKRLDYFLSLARTVDPPPAVLDDAWQAPTGTIRLTYRFREDTHVFWKYTRGWKPGTFNATSNSFAPPSGDPPLVLNLSQAAPETIDAFETGVRGSWLEGRLGIDLSVFYYDYQDYQLFVAQQFAVAGNGGVPEFVILNAESAAVYGAEVDATVRPWLGAFANVRFGWLESEFLDFVQVQQEPIPSGGVRVKEVVNTGNRLLNSPQFKVSLTGEQTLPLGRWGSLTARYDGVWSSTTYFDATEGLGVPASDGTRLPQETIGQPAFWLHNARLSYRLPGGQVEIAAWVRNIEDTAYKTFAFDAISFNKTTVFFVGDPRTFGGTLTVNF